jgi:hypothetical protein
MLSGSFFDRLVRAAKLDADLYEEVEADKNAMGQAMAVVVLSSVATGLGGVGRGGVGGLFAGAVTALIAWFLWAVITYIIGVKFFPEPQTRSDYGELLRTIGFSSSPGLLRIIGIVPFLGDAVFFMTAVWMLVTMVIAVRQALDYTSTWRAVGVCIVGWFVQSAAILIVFAVVGGPS